MTASAPKPHGFEDDQFYTFHCHILEHATAMMLNVKVI
jgi:FtsP/CotA-like multicopper oxidase with cupredoxin domain